MEMTGVYHGLPTRTIASRHLTVEYLAEAGPRLVGLRLAGRAENLLAETPDTTWPTVFGTYHLYGGHRLWHAPEARPRSSVPDASGLQVEEMSDGIRLQGPIEVFTGIRKTIEIHLDPDRPVLTLNHRLCNEGAWPVEVSASGPAEPCKVGYFNHQGWVAFARAGLFLVKRFVPQPGRPHVDFGCNVEVFAGPVCLELETLGPLCRLEPGAEVEHDETWEIYADGWELPADLAALAALAW